MAEEQPPTTEAEVAEEQPPPTEEQSPPTEVAEEQPPPEEPEITPQQMDALTSNEEEDVFLKDEIGNMGDDQNAFFKKVEKIEFYKNGKDTSNDFYFLYPNINDPNFNVKIANKKEFADTKYDGTLYDIKKQSEIMCNAEFELMPHQIFVKNFMSFQTPYNSLLLYHNLGTGKTCSAIGIAEEMRIYLKQMGINQRIIVVASPNVQDNFKLQLFNDKKLKKEGGVWNIQSCIGNSLLKEVNPTNLKGLDSTKIINNIKSIINTYYVFMGYVEFANYVSKKTENGIESSISEKDKKIIIKKNIKKFFNNRLIIIDEVHNIRLTDENKNKRTATKLFDLARHTDNLRMLLLSATPMYNSYKEIIWITNLMNLNDKRSQIDISEVFDKNGNFRQNKKEGKYEENGRELLKRKLTGYVSYVRGENPYTFPYRIYPSLFSPNNTFSNDQIMHPTIQLNKKKMDNDAKLKHIQVYLNEIGSYQEECYNIIMSNLLKTTVDDKMMPTFENIESLGYEQLQSPLQSLNIVYPNPTLDKIIVENNYHTLKDEEKTSLIASFVGKQGLSNVMNHIDNSEKKPPERYNFKYKKEVLEKYGKIFNPENIKKYSGKIHSICEIIKKSKGIIMIYSQYIDGGLVPMALALEEMGFTKYTSQTGGNVPKKSLFETSYINNIEPLDSLTMKKKKEVEPSSFKPAKYVMITGDKSFSPNNAEDVKYVTEENNKNGDLVKVILISKAGAEGLDFKYIRQSHILDPWYNLNRIEQIIGRAVRNLSHCKLAFEERNVEIYLHSTLLNKTPDEECADLYIYRLAEKKAVQIGNVTRLLKETSVDCLLNISQTNLTAEKLFSLVENQNIQIHLSSGMQTNFKIGDKPYTEACDYMGSCEFVCSPDANIQKKDIITDTYNNNFVKTNNDRLVEKIKQLFKEQHFYKINHLINSINIVKQYPLEQIYYALSYFIKNKNEFLVDKYGRLGNLVNKDEYYLFQPIEMNDEATSIFEKSVPIDNKQNFVFLDIPQKVSKEEDTVVGVEGVSTEQPEKDESVSLYENLIMDMETKITTTFTLVDFKEAQNKWDWYMHTSKIIHYLKDLYKISDETLMKHVVYHILDTLLLPKKFVLIKHLYKENDFVPKKKLEEIIKTYFDEKIMETPKKKRGILMTKDNHPIIYVQSKENREIWTESEPEDLNLNNFGSVIGKFNIPSQNMFHLVGFFSLFKNKDMVFKVKDMKDKRNTGAKCDSAGKKPIIDFLNKIQTIYVYNTENTKSISQMGLCAMLEILMRHYTKENNYNPAMFLSSELAFSNLQSQIK